MGRRARRSGLALCAALVLCVTGATVQPLPVEQAPASSTRALASARRDDGPAVVPDRYLIQTSLDGEPARAALLSAITATGAQVNFVYSDTWDGLSVTATEAQLRAIQALRGVQDVFPVYALELDPSVEGDGAGRESESPSAPSQTPATEAPSSGPAERTRTTESTETGDDPEPDPEPGPPVTASPDELTVEYLATGDVDVLANDENAVADSVIFTDPGASEDGKTLVAAGQGVLTVNDEGIVTFASLPGWVGSFGANYQVTGADGSTANATISITVTAPAQPVAHDDTARTVAGEPVTIRVLDNDDFDGRTTPRLDSLRLIDASADQGDWAVEEDGSLGFRPAAGFVGRTSVEYAVADDLDRTTTATVTVSVLAADRSVSTDYHTPVTTELLPSSADPGSLRLLDQTKEEPENLVTELSVDGQGRFSVEDGSVTFTPDRGFAGAADAVTYHFTDADGQPAEAELVVTVRLPAGPTAAADVARSGAGEAVAIDVLANDDPAPDVFWDESSLCLVEDESCRPAVTNPLVGTWTVTREGTEPPAIEFEPAAGFRGTATITYEVRDEFGQPVTAGLSVLVYSLPIEDHDLHGPARHPVRQQVLGDDQPGEVVLVGEGTSEDGKSRSTTAGTWTVDGNTITFTPDDAFHGAATATRYQVVDAVGTAAEATITVTIGALPHAVDDSATTKQNVALTGDAAIDPLANDVGGDDGTGNAANDKLLRDSVVLVAAGATEDGKRLDVAGVGVWTVDADSGRVGFVPVNTFVGDASVRYRVTDIHGNTGEADITVTVTRVTPVAEDHSAHGPAWQPVGPITVLATEPSDDHSAPLPGTVVLVGEGAAADGKSRTTPAGTWTVNPDDTVTFTPDNGFHGESTGTAYRVTDANESTAEAQITVTIGALTTVSDLREATSQNVTISVDPAPAVTLGDDGAGAPGTLQSIRLPDSPNAEGNLLISEGEGIWQIEDNRISFNPETTFVGTTTAVKFAITDSFGNTVIAAISIDVVAITPTIAADTAITPANRTVTVPVLANDRPGTDIHGNPTERLDYAKVALVVDAATTEPEVLVTSRGTWRVTAAGIVFIPKPNVVGESKVQYRVLDHNETPGYGWISVNVGAIPRAGDDAWKVDQGLTLSQPALANDLAGDDGSGKAESRSFTSVVFTDAKATDGGRRIANASYTWTVDAGGTVKFTPYWRFTGTAATTYKATDRYGNSTTARITITVAPTAPTSTEKRLSAIGALQSNADGTGIKVGIIDSGIDYTHPDLGGNSKSTFPTARVTKGRNYTGGGAPMDCFGHGTHVAGIVGADGNPKQRGAYGVAPKVTFGAYRVFDCNGGGTTDNVLKAMQQAASDGMNVINLSLGATSVSWPNETAYPLTQAAANLVKKGIVVVASAGNTTKGLFTVGSPAVAPGVISVAAASSDSSRVESYSAMGLAADLSLSPTLTTPGSGVYSTVPQGHQDKGGTSMAAPQVAGAVAEILQARKWKTTPGTPAKVAALLYSTAVPLKSASSKLANHAEAVFRQGAGLLRLDAALKAQVTASPASLKLGEGTTETATVTLTNAGAKAITYQVAAVTGTSAAASTGSRTDVGNQTPDWAYGGVGFKASPARVTVPAGRTAKVKVTISAPSKILAKKQGMLYGGWVRFTAAGQQTVSVPFAGIRGDYQKVKLLPSGNRRFTSGNVSIPVKLPALAYQTSGTIEPTYSGTRTFHIGRTGGQPHVMFHLDYPTSAIRLKATNTKTRKSYYAVLSGTSTQFGKRGRDEGHTSVAFYGVYKNSKGTLARVPKGTYKLQLRVLKPLGSSKKSSHWETYTTRSFKLTWS